MFNFFKITCGFAFFLLCIGCVTTNTKSTRNLCLKENRIIKDYASQQKNYTLEIPNNWVGFFDTHCMLAYKPKTSVKQKPYIVVQVLDKTSIKVNTGITNLEEFTNDYVKHVIAKNTNPQLNVSYQEHSLYKKYSVISYKTSFLGNIYTSLTISFYYNSKPFRLTYFAQIDEFENYLEDFTTMLETFRITV